MTREEDVTVDFLAPMRLGQYGVWRAVILTWLGARSEDDLVSVMPEQADQEEPWDLPPDWHHGGHAIVANGPGWHVGALYFGEVEGVRCVAEQAAAPLIFWANRGHLA